MSPLDQLDVVALRQLVTSFRDAVRTHAPMLNRLNVYPVPDGDTGTNMARTLDAVVEEVAGAADDMAATCDAISHGSLMGARGNSGVILSQILRGVARTLRDDSGDTTADATADETGEATGDATGDATGSGGATRFAEALTAAAAGAYQAVLKPVEGTILTVARESAEAATAAAGAAGATLLGVVEAARDAAQASLARTPDLLPALKSAGVVDAGGAGFVLFLDAALHVVAGRPLPEPDDAGGADAAAPPVDAGASAARSIDRPHTPIVAGVGGPLDVSEQRYEVMYLLAIDDQRIEEVKRAWGAIGDSIVVVGGDGLWNCHVHTNDIGGAVEIALDLGGRPSRIRVTDLFEEVADEHAERDAAIAAQRSGANRSEPVPEDDDAGPTPVRPSVCDVVAVSSGDGIAALFRDLGVRGLVAGGQTANPSTRELLAVVESVPATSVVLLPNNKNIIAVAEQVDGLTSKRVTVVPTRSMPEALAALVVYDPELDAEANRRQMAEAAASVVTGEVTRAVRSSDSPVGPVAEGDWIGLEQGEGIVAVAADVCTAATTLLERLVDSGRDLVTIVTGADARPADTAAIEGWLADARADLDVEVHDGGQPLYPYLFGVE